MIDLRLYSGAPSPFDVILRFVFGWGSDVLGCMHIGDATAPSVAFGQADVPSATMGDARPARLVLGPVEVC